MSLTLFHRHALEDYLAEFEAKANPNHLCVIRRPAIFSILAHRGHEASVGQALKSIDGIGMRDCALGEWLVVSTASGAAVVETLLGEIAGGSVVDQSEGRVMLQISGPNARKILAKCVAVDLHSEAFPIGASANMLCCHVAANLARTGAETFEIIVPRSFAGSVFEEMMEMGREFALTAAFANS
jgi:heterotetrameric sarcosine oxidase gamma subunit